ncbi:P-loop NTPase fold protein [Fibrobacter sp.]|uniref:P-loop NTPase fold protein n=1 Tax=Fibrobacter sp. TaxID=35828 RepID=UPI00388ED28F
MAIAFPNIAAYVAIKYFQGFEFDFSAPYAIFALYIFTLLVIFFIFILKSRKHNKANKDEDALFADREKDLECLKNYLRSYKIVGLNAKWGDGKTFLINKLRKQLANDYHFITIEVLASTIDSIETYIIDEISNLLEINGIYPSKSLKIKRFFERSNYGWLKALFEKNESYDKMMESLICDLEKLDKPLILNFEDIDRLASGDIVMKIFSLTEKLSKSEKIKVIFQYDNQKLLNVLKQDNIFIEKYIPHEVNLTKISFFNQLKLSCISKKFQDFPLNEVLECSAIPVPRDIQFLFLTDNIVNLVPKDFSIRQYGWIYATCIT